MLVTLEVTRSESLLFDVGMNVEVSKKDDKGSGVAKQSVVHPLWEIAVNVKGMTAMNERSCKLYLRDKNTTNKTLIREI